MPYIVLWLIAFALRGIYLSQIHEAPVFEMLMGDAQHYDMWAQEISGGNWLGDQTFYQAPLYPYFLGVLYRLVGRDLLILRLVQTVLGATSCLFVALAGRYFFHKAVGLLAGGLLACYPMAIFFDALVQKPTLNLFFLSLLLYVLGRMTHAGHLRWSLAAGVAVGAMTLLRENAIMLAIAIGVWLAVGFGSVAWKERLKWIIVFVCGLVIVLFPVGMRNKLVGGEFHWTTHQFGPNFYIGNNALADGTYRPSRWGRGSAEFGQQDAAVLAEAASGRTLNGGEVSRFWTTEALSYISSNPGPWLRLMTRKWFLVWNATELADTEDPYTYSDWSTLLRFLVHGFHFGVLCPLAVFGICATWPRRSQIWLLYLMLLLSAGSVTLFFVFARYRFPLIPLLVLFAAAGLVHGIVLFRERRFKMVLVCATLTIVVGFASNAEMISKDDIRATTHFNLGVNYIKQQDSADMAIDHLTMSLSLNPGDVQTHYNLAVALARQGKDGEAIVHYAEAIQRKRDYAEAHYGMSLALMRQGRVEEAVAHHTEAVRLDPDNASAHNNLGVILYQRGRYMEAIAHYRQALRIDARYAQAHNNLGSALAATGEMDGAVEHFRRSRELAPESLSTLKNLAWLLATSEDPGVRNGAEAVQLAEELCQKTGYGEAESLDVLAAAYAAANRFDDATRTAENATERALLSGKEKFAEAIGRRLALYRAHVPYRSDGRME